MNQCAFSLRPLWASSMVAMALSVASPAWAIVNGANTTSFSAVGVLGDASGVLIADNWVLTAAHVASALSVGNSSFSSLNGASLIDAVYTFSSADFPSNDIALVHLSAPLNTGKPILNDVVVQANQVASLGALTMVTAQNQNPNGYAATHAQGVATTHTLDGVTSTVNWLLTDGPAYLESGDSGGALFKGAVSDSAGEVLLGIASAALVDDTTGVSEGSAYTQVASYKSWITATMAGSGQQAVWISSVPEPSVWVLTVLGGLAVFAFRSGQIGRNG